MKIGVVGGGQLGRMLAMAGAPLGMKFVFLDPAHDACAAQMGHLICSNYSDHYAIRELVNQCEAVTFEFESIPPETVEFIGQFVPVYPVANSLKIARDRWTEKQMFQDNGIPTAEVAAIHSQEELQEAVARIGVPGILKTRTLGYDGKGQKVLKTQEEADNAFEELGSVPLIYEGFVDFDCELSCIAVRGRDGSQAFYPLVENEHQSGILYKSTATENHPLQGKAQEYVGRVMDALSYVGVITFEFFAKGDTLIANEIAPRVHNSGHWTIEGAETSQFENHIRAVAGLPLGSTERLGHAAMYNLIGRLPGESKILEVPGANYHNYGKEPKPGRKIGHITVHSADQKRFDQSCSEIEGLIQNVL